PARFATAARCPRALRSDYVRLHKTVGRASFERDTTMSILISWLILTVAVWIAAAIVPGVSVKGIGGAIVVAAIFGIVNWLIGWLFFFVIGIATLGLGFLLAFITRWVVDAIILKLTDLLTDRLTIRGFGPALLAALVMSALGTLGEWLVR
ncbi:MAG TPA: hypothetical protein DFS52_01335, partial [Myxococcales bacterium]|nr:hypothetical protein [Myxococcales bacterium]